MKKNYFSKNRTRFVVKGLNQERILNELVKKVNIYNFKRESYEICQFETDYSKRKFVKNALSEKGMEIISLSNFGFFSFIKNIFSSYGIIFALILSFLFYSFQYSFIWKIEVYGETIVEERVIKDYVNSILPSKAKGNINTKQLEMLTKEHFKEISSISIAIVGQTLVLNINEAVLPEEMEGNFQPLISDYDALITEINLIQGTLAVDEGMVVKKGDVLVYPYIIDSQGEKRDVAPKAEIFADIWINEKSMHYDYQVVVRRTGKKIEKSEVFLNNLLVYSQNKVLNFEHYEVEYSEIKLTKNLLLPLKLKKTVYYQTEFVEIKEDFLNVKDKIIESTRQKALIFLEENEIIKEEKYYLREEGGCHEVNYTLTVNRNIGG